MDIKHLHMQSKPERIGHFKPMPALLLGLLVAACGGSGGENDEASKSLAAGQEPYLRYCASCHGNRGEGKQPAFPPLAGSEWLELPAEGLARIVIRGLRGEITVAGERYNGLMPPMRHVADDDIAAIVGFLESTWAAREPTLDGEDITRIRGQAEGSPLRGRDGVEATLEEDS